jgi:hypothetical protein
VTLDGKKTSAKDIIAKTNEHLESHQRVQEVIIWPDEDFPRTPTRKIIRFEVNKYASTDKFPSVTSKDIKGGNQLYIIIAQVTGKPIGKITSKSTFVNDLGWIR